MVDDRLEPRRAPGDATDQLGAPSLDAHRVEGVVGESGEGRRARRQPQLATAWTRGAGCGLAVRRHQPTPRPVRLVAGHLLLEDGRDQRLEDRLGPRQAARPRKRRASSMTSRWWSPTRNGPSSRPSDARKLVEGQLGAGSPRLGVQSVRCLRDRQGDRSIGGPGRPQGATARQLDGRVTSPAGERRGASGRGRTGRRAGRSGSAPRQSVTPLRCARALVRTGDDAERW